jgi:two-component system response regulator AtoC
VLRELSTGTKQSAQLPIIIMTGFGTSNVRSRRYSSAATTTSRKPFNLDEVLVTVQRFFERQALSHQGPATFVRGWATGTRTR